MYRESDIIHEKGNYWILRRISKNAAIAPLGSVYYEAYEVHLTHSVSTGYVTANRERAINYCDRMAAKVSN